MCAVERTICSLLSRENIFWWQMAGWLGQWVCTEAQCEMCLRYVCNLRPLSSTATRRSNPLTRFLWLGKKAQRRFALTGGVRECRKRTNAPALPSYKL